MPSLLSPRRTTPELSLHATSAQRRTVRRPMARTPAAPPFGWPVAAVVGGLITAARELDPVRRARGGRLARR